MKKKFLYMGLAALSLAVAGTSCTRDFEETNHDPNNMMLGDLQNPYAMFTPTFYGMTNSQWQNYTWFWNDELVQFTTHSGGVTREENRYKIGESNFSSLWNGYANRVTNIMHMIELAKKYKVPAAEAVGLTLKVALMENLTAIYGDIPYKEAFRGRTEGIIQPKFESQKEVYEDMLAELEEANKIYAENKKVDEALKAIDQMYEGDLRQWRKFNNSLMLRLLCRVSGRDEMNAGARIQAIIADQENYPVISSNADNATVKLTGVDPYFSYFHNKLKNDFTSSSYKAAEQVIKMTVYVDEKGVQSYTDPRLPIWFVEGNDGWKGAIAGGTPTERSSSNNGAAQLNYEVFVRDDAPVYYMDYAEVLFILAEMSERGKISIDRTSKELYEEAVKASLLKWAPWGQFSTTPRDITEDDVNVFLASALANWDMAENKLRLIGEQKYLALFWTGMEAYHEVRRTAYPELTIGNGTDYNDYKYPQRFAYPNVTVANNRQNVQEALTRMGGDNTMKTPVWWSYSAITGKELFPYKEH
ncbi:MAG: SusD/RagB family nutrient-binding outer membrane lipoprotein [Bacteroidales bacterium]|nr:SusD/RagB family nutrient-binding outer membrane lipoprotein [Bacteroidales bacterium]